MTPQSQDVLEWRGRTMVDPDGDEVGTVDEIYLDQETGQPEWALVGTGKGSRFVPLTGAGEAGGAIQGRYEKAAVEAAPDVDADPALSQQGESRLYRHYGLQYGEARSATGLPQDAPADAPSRGTGDTDDAMTRSEEELRVGKESRPAGTARLRKYVVTEDVQTTVPVQREEARVEREPITDANVDEALSGPEIGEAEHEVTLHEEQPVVEKRTVPKERVRLTKDTVTDEREISEQVRKERIESDDDRR